MKKKRIITIAVLLFTVTAGLFGQEVSFELGAAISAGDVSLSLSGNGKTMGLALSGTLYNNREHNISISVSIGSGLYFNNSGSGQNMIATRIFPTFGINVDTEAVSISLSPKGEITVTLNAYCADLLLDNPTTEETLSAGVMPNDLQTVMSQISRYEADNPGSVTPNAIQLAIWRSRGESHISISRKVGAISDKDWDISTAILNYR